MVGGVHDPDALDDAGSGQEHGAEQQSVDDERPRRFQILA
jgi:hypothetical protein